MASQREIIERAALRAHDLRENANARLFGDDYRVEPPTIVDLVSSGALVEGRIVHTFRFSGDFVFPYHVQVDENGTLTKYEFEKGDGLHELEELRGLSLNGSFDDVLVRVMQISKAEWAVVKLAVGVAWAYVRTDRLNKLNVAAPVAHEQPPNDQIITALNLNLASIMGVHEDPDAGGEILPHPE